MRRFMPPVACLPVVAVLASLRLIAAIEQEFMPGNDKYYTMLNDIEANVGTVEPAFKSEVLEYTLKLDEMPTSVSIVFALDLTRYNSQYLPDVFVDGVKFQYNPLNTNTVVVPLNESIGPIDRVWSVQVADPKGPTGPFFMRKFNEHTYKVRILQPPEFQNVIKPVSLEVKSGNLLVPPREAMDESGGAFARTYVLTTDVVDVQLNCSQFATYAKANGRNVAMNSTIRVEVLGVRMSVVVECGYQDPTWHPEPLSEPHHLEFQKNLNLTGVTVDLRISAEQGYCAMRADEANAAAGTGGNIRYVCRFDSASTSVKFVAISSDKRPEMVLRTDAGLAYILHHGVMRVVPVTERGNFKLMILGGNTSLSFPVDVMPVGTCDRITCPVGQAVRPDIFKEEAAQRRLCSEKNCTEKDVKRCCAKSAACSTMEDCPKGMKLRPDATKIFCRSPRCNQEDDSARCCGIPTTCEKAVEVCGTGRGVRSDADKYYCSDVECGPSDIDTCCETRASCMEYTFGCPPDHLPAKGPEFQCMGLKCTEKDDAAVCCNIDEALYRKEMEERRKAEDALRLEMMAEEASERRFDAIGCFPDARRTCSGFRCYYDETCINHPVDMVPRLGGLGCFAAGVDVRCRFCGHAVYPPCPHDGSCFDGLCERWDSDKRKMCQDSYGVTCPGLPEDSRAQPAQKFDGTTSEAAVVGGAMGAGWRRAMLACFVAGAGIVAFVRHMDRLRRRSSPRAAWMLREATPFAAMSELSEPED